jgi:hypothetical protein
MESELTKLKAHPHFSLLSLYGTKALSLRKGTIILLHLGNIEDSLQLDEVNRKDPSTQDRESRKHPVPGCLESPVIDRRVQVTEMTLISRNTVST